MQLLRYFNECACGVISTYKSDLEPQHSIAAHVSFSGKKIVPFRAQMCHRWQHSTATWWFLTSLTNWFFVGDIEGIYWMTRTGWVVIKLLLSTDMLMNAAQYTHRAFQILFVEATQKGCGYAHNCSSQPGSAHDIGTNPDPGKVQVDA